MSGPTELLEITTRLEGGRTVVEIAGEIDVYSAARLRERLVELAQAGRYRLIIDMTIVTFMDSSGLGVLVGAMKRARANGGEVCIVGAAEHILQTLRITGLTRVFPIYASVVEALSKVAT